MSMGSVENFEEMRINRVLILLNFWLFPITIWYRTVAKTPFAFAYKLCDNAVIFHSNLFETLVTIH